MNNFRAKFQLLPWMTDGKIVMQLPSDPEHVHAVASYLSELAVVTRRCDPKREPHVIVALTEALTNAIVHGNLEISSELRDSDREEEYFQQIQIRKKSEPFRYRRVEVVTVIHEEGISWTITDEGSGFDVESIPDPTDPENLLRSSGRGLLMMNAFSDRLTFNDKGNQVTLFIQAPNHKPTPCV
jgi:anti-sigma regulatory factor (Ser/Thr protein kinase)